MKLGNTYVYGYIVTYIVYCISLYIDTDVDIVIDICRMRERKSVWDLGTVDGK